ncbi:hypothetical protein PIB30_001153 [Stylosanthes scabra]|uniref:Uncharacterized protein n=1 Tax=Stylosanthes scabra TaxID=79078 RepID=A0ABU6V0X7_9FABA|nr:hypothetical protein [Stylosanthes scabra]
MRVGLSNGPARPAESPPLAGLARPGPSKVAVLKFHLVSSNGGLTGWRANENIRPGARPAPPKSAKARELNEVDGSLAFFLCIPSGEASTLTRKEDAFMRKQRVSWERRRVSVIELILLINVNVMAGFFSVLLCHADYMEDNLVSLLRISATGFFVDRD